VLENPGRIEVENGHERRRMMTRPKCTIDHEPFDLPCFLPFDEKLPLLPRVRPAHVRPLRIRDRPPRKLVRESALGGHSHGESLTGPGEQGILPGVALRADPGADVGIAREAPAGGDVRGDREKGGEAGMLQR